jgi:putative hydrolase of the HAD superfamily
MGIQAVAFDVDGTLYPNIKMYLRAVRFFLNHPLLMYHFNTVRKKIRSIRPIDNFWILQADMLAELTNSTREEAEEAIDKLMYDEWEQIFKGIKVFPEIPGILRSLKQEGIRLGVLSDFRVHTKLAYMQLEGLWDGVVSSEESGYLKPNAEPFRLLLEKLNLPPESVLYVGNHYHYDIIGAKDAGMKAAYFTSMYSGSKRGAENCRADVVFSTYKNFLQKILIH